MSKPLPVQLLHTAQDAMEFKLNVLRSKAVHLKLGYEYELLKMSIKSLEAQLEGFKQFQIDLCNGVYDNMTKGKEEENVAPPVG